MAVGAERSLLVIGGPTGVGKTAVAVELAHHVPLEVISADSRQVYRGMDVATGKPSPAECRAVPHHLIDILDPAERYHAARFGADADAAIAAVRGRGRVPVVVGGTGLYIRTLLRGLDPAPPADPAFRAELETFAMREGRPALHDRLRRQSPEMARRLHPNDQVRVVRALELLRAGSPVGAARVRWQDSQPDREILYVGLTLDRTELGARLAVRVQQMVAAGLVEEVRGLVARGYTEVTPGLQSIGYREFVRVLRGEMTEQEALARMRRDTVRYARRQWAWFLREPTIEWIDVGRVGGAAGAARAIARRLREQGLVA